MEQKIFKANDIVKYNGIIGKVIKLKVSGVTKSLYEIEVLYDPNRSIKNHHTVVVNSGMELYKDSSSFKFAEIKALRREKFLETFVSDSDFFYHDSERTEMLKELSELNKKRNKLIKKLIKKPRK